MHHWVVLKHDSSDDYGQMGTVVCGIFSTEFNATHFLENKCPPEPGISYEIQVWHGWIKIS